jgi:muconolactone delta-isomerase
MREFLVEITIAVPEGTDPVEVERRRAAKAVRAGELAADGHLFQLWRPEGELRSIGVWRADSEKELLKHLREERIEPPTSGRISRIVACALHIAEVTWSPKIAAGLSVEAT